MKVRAAARLALSVAVAGTATLALAPLQWLANRTGLLGRATLPRLWARTVLRGLGWRVRVEGALAPGRPLLVAANHVSWGDIVALAAHADVGFIAKSEVRGWPVFGMLARLRGTVFIAREEKRRTGEQAAAIARRMVAGDALVLFAEGTTADGNLLLPFKSSLFGALALAAREGGRGAEVQPVAIAYPRLYGLPMSRGEREAAAWLGDMGLPAHLWALARRGPLDVVLRFGEPVPFDPALGRKGMARRAETETRQLMADALRG